MEHSDLKVNSSSSIIVGVYGLHTSFLGTIPSPPSLSILPQHGLLMSPPGNKSRRTKVDHHKDGTASVTAHRFKIPFEECVQNHGLLHHREILFRNNSNGYVNHRKVSSINKSINRPNNNMSLQSKGQSFATNPSA